SGSKGVFYGLASQVYGQPSFWAVFFIVPVVCLFPRFATKAIQKVYFPYDVDIIREQDLQGKFDHLEPEKDVKGSDTSSGVLGKEQSITPVSSESYKKKHQVFGSVDEERRPISPPSVVTQNTHHRLRSQNGSDGTNYTGHRSSFD